MVMGRGMDEGRIAGGRAEGDVWHTLRSDPIHKSGLNIKEKFRPFTPQDIVG